MQENKGNEILKILDSDSLIDKKALFAFNSEDGEEHILFKFNIWSRYFFSKYFQSKDAKFHTEIDLNNIRCYRGSLHSYVNIAFRGAAKTVRTKLFIAYAIANDIEHYRKYIQVLSHDSNNSKQISTDIYNMFKHPEIVSMYPEIFEKTNTKREETMGSFTTATGVKLVADTVGTDQRGALQEESKPDLIWFEDFENVVTLRSRVKTKAIWDNMEEARTGRAKDGACIYTCNYISETGNVHKLVTQKVDGHEVMIIPIVDEGGTITWDRYTEADIQYMRETDDNFEGERLCKPSVSQNVYFDRLMLDKMQVTEPKKVIAGIKVYDEFNPSHRYGGGQDIAGGVGLDSSTSVIIDFDVFPAKVVSTYKTNTTKPDLFAYDIERHSNMYGGCIMAPERNNHGHATIAICKQLGVEMYTTQRKQTHLIDSQGVASLEYGWHTNEVTKSKMLSALARAIENGHIEIPDPDIVNELKSYTRDDQIENVKDPRLVTRHYDLLIATAIAWQMKDHAKNKIQSEYRLKQRIHKTRSNSQKNTLR
jgi:hypothetical protein